MVDRFTISPRNYRLLQFLVWTSSNWSANSKTIGFRRASFGIIFLGHCHDLSCIFKIDFVLIFGKLIEWKWQKSTTHHFISLPFQSQRIEQPKICIWSIFWNLSFCLLDFILCCFFGLFSVFCSIMTYLFGRWSDSSRRKNNI